MGFLHPGLLSRIGGQCPPGVHSNYDSSLRFATEFALPRGSRFEAPLQSVKSISLARDVERSINSGTREFEGRSGNVKPRIAVVTNARKVASDWSRIAARERSPGRQPGDFFVLGNKAPEARYSNGIFRPDGAGSESDTDPRADARGLEFGHLGNVKPRIAVVTNARKVASDSSRAAAEQP